jgi:sec-independent protein translocase protein TatA
VTFTFALLPNIGPLEVAIVLVIVLIIFGPKRIPATFRAIGDAFKGFRDTVGDEDEETRDPAALPESSQDAGGPSGPGDQPSETGEKTGAKTDV